MNALKINIPKGFVIDNFDQKTGEIRFKEQPKSVMERIKTIDDILTANDWTQERFDEFTSEMEPDEKAYILLKFLAEFTSEMEPDEKAYILLKFLAKALNEGWIPDWNNGNYCFKSKELSDYAAKQFLSLYKQFMTL
jgi:hypothetical protein